MGGILNILKTRLSIPSVEYGRNGTVDDTTFRQEDK